MAEANASITNDSSGWSSTPGATATAAPLSATSYLEDNSTTSVVATDQVDSSIRITEAAYFTSMVISVAGLILNVIAFMAVYRTHMRNRALRLGLLNLACIDILHAQFLVGWTMLSYHYIIAQQQGLTLLGSERSEYCALKVWNWIMNVSGCSGAVTLNLLAVQQFITVRWPLRTANRMSSRGSAYALAVVWLVSALIGLSPAIAIAASTEHHPWVGNWTQKGTSRFCYQVVIYDDKSIYDSSSYVHDLGQAEIELSFTLLSFSFLCTSLSVLAVSYGYVMYKMKQPRPGDGCAGPTAGMAASGRRRQDTKRVLSVLGTVTLLLLCINLPTFICETLCNRVVTQCFIWRTELAVTLSALSTVADPLVYILRLKNVRHMALSPLSRFRHFLMKSNEAHTVERRCEDS